MRFFKIPVQNGTSIPFIDLGVLGVTVGFSVWKLYCNQQEKWRLQRENPDKIIVAKPRKGPLGTEWKWSVEEDSPDDIKKNRPF